MFSIAPAQAFNLIQNGSFENIGGTFANNGQGFMSLTSGSTVIPGWTTTNPFVAWISDSNRFGVRTPFGSFSPDLKSGSNLGGISQTIDTIIGGEYSLSFYLGVSNPSFRGPVSVNVIAGSTNQIFTFNQGGSGSQWGNFSLDFTATSDSTPISIIGVSSPSTYIGLDNVSVVRSVPEPLTILGTGTAIGFGATFKRKLAKNKNQNKKS